MTPAHRISLTIALALLPLALAACNVATPVAYILTGRGNVQSLYQLDAERTHVIVVDDFRSVLPKRSYRRLIGESAENFLISRGKFPDDKLIPTNAALRVISAETWESRISLTELGRQLGADVVIYLDIAGWTLSRDAGGVSPAAQGNVKIIDAENDKRLFPLDAKAYPLVIQLPRKPGQLPADATARRALEESLANNIGLHLAKLFYKHEVGTNRYIGD